MPIFEYKNKELGFLVAYKAAGNGRLSAAKSEQWVRTCERGNNPCEQVWSRVASLQLLRLPPPAPAPTLAHGAPSANAADNLSPASANEWGDPSTWPDYKRASTNVWRPPFNANTGNVQLNRKREDIMAKGEALKEGEYLSEVDVWSVPETHGLDSKRPGLMNRKPCRQCRKLGMPCIYRGTHICLKCYVTKGKCLSAKRPSRSVLRAAPVKADVAIRRAFMLDLERKGWIPPLGYKKWFNRNWQSHQRPKGAPRTAPPPLAPGLTSATKDEDSDSSSSSSLSSASLEEEEDEISDSDSESSEDEEMRKARKAKRKAKKEAKRVKKEKKKQAKAKAKAEAKAEAKAAVAAVEAHEDDAQASRVDEDIPMDEVAFDEFESPLDVPRVSAGRSARLRRTFRASPPDLQPAQSPPLQQRCLLLRHPLLAPSNRVPPRPSLARNVVTIP
ncbi:unnamed protein product [Peniophora sp. CBMAI 1063]|nr:unnamed protein product [Peniophora sp. CBMAI 1063]